MSLTLSQQLDLYRRMQRIRQFEQALIDAQLRGHLSIGQEAAIVGACMALRHDDYITGTHRSHGHPIGKGADLRPLMAELFGKQTGICKGRGGSMHLADTKVGIIGESAIVGGGIPLAVGAGLSIQLRGSDQVSLAFFGDGAANQGTFGESLNLAAIWKLPVIFLCENNLYAISTSVAKSLRSVSRTGRLVIADNSHRTCGVAAEVAAVVAEEAFECLQKPVQRVTTPDVQIPSSPVLERPLYPGAQSIAAAARRIL